MFIVIFSISILIIIMYIFLYINNTNKKINGKTSSTKDKYNNKNNFTAKKEFNICNNDFFDNCTYNDLLCLILGKFISINDVILKSQLTVINDIVNKDFSSSVSIKERYILYFTHGKNSNKPFEFFCYKLINFNKGKDEYSYTPYIILLHYFYRIATCKNQITNGELNYIYTASKIFKIPVSVVDEIGAAYEHFDDKTSYNIDCSMDKYFHILCCNKTDDFETIKSQYRKLVKKYHPDMFLNKNLSSAEEYSYEEKFQSIQNAYEVLSKYYEEQ